METYARADEGDLELIRPAVLLDGVLELGEGSSKVRSVGTVDVGLELGEVDLDKLIIRSAGVGLQVVLEGVGIVSNVGCQAGKSDRIIQSHANAEGAYICEWRGGSHPCGR